MINRPGYRDRFFGLVILNGKKWRLSENEVEKSFTRKYILSTIYEEGRSTVSEENGRSLSFAGGLERMNLRIAVVEVMNEFVMYRR